MNKNDTKPLTRDKKEILKKYMGSIKFENFSLLVYESSMNILEERLLAFSNKVDLTNDELELLKLYNEFIAKCN